MNNISNMQIGGDGTCNKCKQHYSGAEVHICPEDIKQKNLSKYMCPNGSVTCGMFKAIGKKDRCNHCKKDEQVIKK